MSERRPAEAWPPGVFIAEELEARGWSTTDLAIRMGGDNPALDLLTVEMLIAVDSPNALIGEVTAERLGRAFGTSAELWLNLEKIYRDWHPDTLPLPEPPDA